MHLIISLNRGNTLYLTNDINSI